MSAPQNKYIRTLKRFFQSERVWVGGFLYAASNFPQDFEKSEGFWVGGRFLYQVSKFSKKIAKSECFWVCVLISGFKIFQKNWEKSEVTIQTYPTEKNEKFQIFF